MTAARMLETVSALLAFPRGRSGPDPILAGLQAHWAPTALEIQQVSLDPAASDADLAEHYLDALQARRGSGPVVLGGFSRGARVAAQIASDAAPVALICLGFPFHVRGEPGNRHGLEALRRVEVPTLVVQGTRDAHGNRQEVAGYRPLPANVHVHWLEDGNHRFAPRARSGLSLEQHLHSAAAIILEFIADTMQARRDG